ncbi:hypothetical protein A2U01_0103296, partial [Trifolium medium]|nr:hypothetical protein [Trifolium medium]
IDCSSDPICLNDSASVAVTPLKSAGSHTVDLDCDSF